jgi:hypothetical protein
VKKRTQILPSEWGVFFLENAKGEKALKISILTKQSPWETNGFFWYGCC